MEWILIKKESRSSCSCAAGAAVKKNGNVDELLEGTELMPRATPPRHQRPNQTSDSLSLVLFLSNPMEGKSSRQAALLTTAATLQMTLQGEASQQRTALFRFCLDDASTCCLCFTVKDPLLMSKANAEKA